MATTTETTSYYMHHESVLPPVKTQQVGRLVGYYEYMRALSILDALANRLSPEELKVLEDIVQERDEFSVYTNISRRLERGAGPLSEPAIPGDDFNRRGLGWMMALARVELGAMVAGFTDRPKPFAVLPPTRYEYAPFQEMMLDGLRTHYHALQNDPVTGYYWSLRAGRPATLEINEMQAIAYSRRVAIALEFAEAIQQMGQHDMTPAQQAQVAAWKKDLEELLQVILKKGLRLGIAHSEGTVQSSNSRAVEESKSDCFCPRLGSRINGLAKQGKVTFSQQPVNTQSSSTKRSGNADPFGRR